MARDCVYKASSKSTCAEDDNGTSPEWIRSSKTGSVIAYRHKLEGPQYFMLSHPLSRFRRSDPYWVGYEDAKFCTHLGLIPAYAVNLDKYTLLRLWGDQARALFSPRAEPIPQEEDYVYWKMSYNSGRLPELSSMNFILKQSANLAVYKGIGIERIKRYFTFGFWCFPEKGLSDSSIILNDDSGIRLVLKASKSLYIPERTYTKKMDLGLEKQVPVEMITLWGLGRNEDRYYLQKIENVVLAKGIADTLAEEKHRGRFLINGIVSEFRKRSRRFPTLTCVALYEVSNLELIMSIIGLVVSRRYKDGDALSNVGPLNEVKNETEHVLGILLSKVSLDRTFADSMPDQFSLAINYLSPLIVTDQMDIFYMHPSIFISLLSSGLTHRILKDDLNTVNLLKILDMLFLKPENKILRTEESNLLKKNGIFPEILLTVLKIAKRQMLISKSIRKPIEIKESELDIEERIPSEREAVKPSRDESAIDILTEQDQDIFHYMKEYERKMRKAKRDR